MGLRPKHSDHGRPRQEFRWAFAGVHFLRPANRRTQWWSGGRDLPRSWDSSTPCRRPRSFFSGFVSLLVAGFILAVATLWTRSLWLAIGLHGLDLLSANSSMAGEISGKATGRLLALIGPNVVSGAVPTGLLPLAALVLTGRSVVLSQECLCGPAWFLRRWGSCFSPALRWLCGGDTLGLVVWRLFGFADRRGAPAAKLVRDHIPDRLSRSFVPTVEERHFRYAVAVMQSRGVVRELIHRFKYGGETWLAGLLAEFLKQGLRDARLVGKPFDAVVPVPLHPLRRREREFNQAEVLARDLARGQGWSFATPCKGFATPSRRRTSIAGIA